MRLVVIGVSVIPLFVASLASSQPRPGDGPLLVSAHWLAERLHDPAIVILRTGQGNPNETLISGVRLAPALRRPLSGRSREGQ